MLAGDGELGVCQSGTAVALALLSDALELGDITSCGGAQQVFRLLPVLLEIGTKR